MKIKNKIILPGNILYIDEKTAGIRYHGIDKKGPRPFLVIKVIKSYTDFYNELKNYIIVCPITRTKNIDGKPKHKSKMWTEIKYKGELHYVINDIPMILHKHKIEWLEKKKLADTKFALTLMYSVNINIKKEIVMHNKLFNNSK